VAVGRRRGAFQVGGEFLRLAADLAIRWERDLLGLQKSAPKRKCTLAVVRVAEHAGVAGRSKDARWEEKLPVCYNRPKEKTHGRLP